MTDDKAPSLTNLRQEIDAVDAALVALLAKRFGLVKQVAIYKKRHALPAAIPERIEEVVERVCRAAAAQGFPPETADKLWRLLIADMIVFEEKQLAP